MRIPLVFTATAFFWSSKTEAQDSRCLDAQFNGLSLLQQKSLERFRRQSLANRELHVTDPREAARLAHPGSPGTHRGPKRIAWSRNQGLVQMLQKDSTATMANEKSARRGMEVPQVRSGVAEAVHFRSVSITLRCVLALTFLFLCVYSLLAVTRNVDELSGRTQPSIITETLTVAARCSSYAPIMAALFLGCRMYVVESTGGLGEPQPWVKDCEIAATCGMYIEFCLVLALPLLNFGSPMGWSKDFPRLVGEKYEVHPRFFNYGYMYDRMFYPSWIVQLVPLVPIYGGVFGVIVGMWTFPGKEHVCPAVIASMILAAWYFVAYGFLFVARARQQILDKKCWALEPPEGLDGWETEDVPQGIGHKMEKFALSATYPMDVAPMLVVLFLGVRLRMAQMDTEDVYASIPQVWAQISFCVCAGALPLLALLNGYAGMVSDKRLGYYGEQLYSAQSTLLVITKHAVAACLYLCVLLVVISIVTLRPAEDGSAPPLSPTMRCVLQLSAAFFTVHGLQWLVSAVQDLFGKARTGEEGADEQYTSLHMLQDTAVAARTSVQFCPILAVLIMGCRMRALQITDQSGEPQGWAQQCMYMVTFSVLVQAMCCWTLPILTGKATKIDEDGNPEYNFRPLIGAYTVTLVKYVMFVMIFGGVAAVGASMFMITPETARPDYSFFEKPRPLMYASISFLLILLLTMVLSATKVVAVATKLAVECVDPVQLGVHVRVGMARFSIRSFSVHLGDVVVDNYDPMTAVGSYMSPYLLCARNVIVKLDMWKFITSGGKSVEVIRLVVDGVDACYEKRASTNNARDLLSFLEQGKKSAPEQHFIGDAAPQEVNLHRLELSTPVAVKVFTKVSGRVRALRVALGDTTRDDSVEACHGRLQVTDILIVLVKALLKVVVANAGVIEARTTKMTEKLGAASPA